MPLDNARLAVVGGGIIGTALALAAVERGHTVFQFDRQTEPHGATIRNFGLIWILGRAAGRELDLALRGRELWRALGERAPALQFRPSGALIVAQHPSEMRVLEAFVRSGSADARAADLVEPDALRRVEPAVRGPVLGAIRGNLDAQVEPGAILPALRGLAASTGRYTYYGGLAVGRVVPGQGGVRDVTGRFHACDIACVCTGRDLEVLEQVWLQRPPLHVRTLQMLEAESGGPVPMGTVVDGGALRYYPAFDVPERTDLPAPEAVAERFAAQLMVTPRVDGWLTVGDTHVDDEPDSFSLDEEAYLYLMRRFESVFGHPPGRVRRRWMGQYLRVADGADCYVFARLSDDLVAVTGVGGMGLTAGPSIAVEVLDRLGL